MSYLSVPDLIAMLWLAVVLARMQGRKQSDLLHLWIIGLLLIVVEGIARIIYQETTHLTHALTHAIALDAYFLAGLAFFQSAGGKLRFLPKSELYLAIFSAPHVVLLTLYGSNVFFRPLYVAIAVIGLLVSLIAAQVLKRSWQHVVCHIIIWVPVLAAVATGNFRLASYLSLFFVYAATAVAFYLTLPSGRRGGTVLITGFLVWSLCFLTHPWIAEQHASWVPMAEQVWDLQKFFVIFGLLIVSLEDQSAANEYQALHDTLTGLPNRRLFEDRLEMALARANRSSTRALLFNIDLNDFKQINDTFGHEAGDNLLREVGSRLAEVTRETDTVARMGGDEFYVLINDFNLAKDLDSLGNPDLPAELQARAANLTQSVLREQTARLSETFRRAVESTAYTLEVAGTVHTMQVRMSIGGVVFPDEAADRNELCRLADQRMYADKQNQAGTTLEQAAV